MHRSLSSYIKNMDRSDLIDAILVEMERVWGDDGFSGAWEEYEWLLENYGITEDEDGDWMGILAHESGEVDPDDEWTPQWEAFVTDDDQVIPLLSALLKKYRSNSVSVPDNLPHVIRRIDPASGLEIREVRPL
jgi:hypothetical protein